MSDSQTATHFRCTGAAGCGVELPMHDYLRHLQGHHSPALGPLGDVALVPVWQDA